MRLKRHLSKYEIAYILAIKLIALTAISYWLIQPHKIVPVPTDVARHLF